VALLEDLQARGLDTSRPVLLVLDGAKALHAAAKRVWGQNGVSAPWPARRESRPSIPIGAANNPEHGTSSE
jgi:hypothetical protein